MVIKAHPNLSPQQRFYRPRTPASRAVQSGKHPEHARQFPECLYQIHQRINLPDQMHRAPDALPDLHPARQSKP